MNGRVTHVAMCVCLTVHCYQSQADDIQRECHPNWETAAKIISSGSPGDCGELLTWASDQDPRAARTCLELLETAPNHETRRYAWQLLTALQRGEERNSQLVAELQRLTEERQPLRLRRIASFAATVVAFEMPGRTEKSRLIIYSGAEDSDPLIRWLAVRAMSWEGLDVLRGQFAMQHIRGSKHTGFPERCVSILKGLAENDASQHVRVAAITALGWYASTGWDRPNINRFLFLLEKERSRTMEERLQMKLAIVRAEHDRLFRALEENDLLEFLDKQLDTDSN